MRYIPRWSDYALIRRLNIQRQGFFSCPLNKICTFIYRLPQGPQELHLWYSVNSSELVNSNSLHLLFLNIKSINLHVCPLRSIHDQLKVEVRLEWEAGTHAILTPAWSNHVCHWLIGRSACRSSPDGFMGQWSLYESNDTSLSRVPKGL